MFLSTTKGRSPVPWYRHSGTQPRILACWCSPPPLAPPPHELSARATRATNTPVANSALSLLMTIPPYFPTFSWGCGCGTAGCTTGSPHLLDAHFYRDMVLCLCPLV